jgi:hypothetical protein
MIIMAPLDRNGILSDIMIERSVIWLKSDLSFVVLSVRRPKTLLQSVLRGGPRSVRRLTFSQQKTSVRYLFQKNSVNPPGTSSKESDEPDRPNVIPFDLDNDQEDTNLTYQDDATSSLDASAELMRWHLRLGHLPFANIR